MKTLMVIDTTHGGIFFSLGYVAAFLVAAGIMIHEGFRKGYPKSAWLLIALSSIIFFIIGDKIFTYTPEQWTEVFTRFHFPPVEKKTALGGIIGLFAGIYLSKSWLRFNRPTLDTLAISLPIAMAISHIGCLMAGCCYGTPTNLPWGIHYDTASPAWHVQMAQGMINSFDTCSLAVQPAQLYQVIGCLIIAFVVWKSRKRCKSNGNMFLYSLLCYLVLRFFVEFVRDPATNGIAGQLFLGLKIVHWLILGIILVGFTILLIREYKVMSFVLYLRKKFYRKDAKTRSESADLLNSLRLSALAVKEKENSTRTPQVSDLRQVLFATFLSAIVLAGRKWFDPLELLTILVFLIPSIITLTTILYRRFSVAGFRWIIPVLLVCSFSFMAQKSVTDNGKNDKITFPEVGITGMFGKYSEELQKVMVTYKCNEPNTYSYDKYAIQSVPFYQTGLNFSYNIWQGRYNKKSFGARVFLGNEYPDQTIPSSKNGPIIGISPYASLNWEYFGFTGGFSVGKMKIPIGKPEYTLFDGEIISKGKSWFGILPFISARIGSLDIFFVEGGYASGLFPYCSPFANFRAGIGTGFGRSNGTSMVIGLYGYALSLKMVYPIKNKFVVEGFYADNFSTGNKASRVLSLGFSYRFLNTKKYKEQLTATTMTYHSWVGKTDPVKKLRDAIVDFDSNVYSIVAVGGQVWMAENLKVTHFRDGSEITTATSDIPGSGQQYNWQAVMSNSGLCPTGWHVPSLSEWTTLFNSLGNQNAGKKLGEDFSCKGKISHWWSSTELGTLQAQSIYMDNETIGIMFSSAVKTSFLSIRCMRDK